MAITVKMLRHWIGDVHLNSEELLLLLLEIANGEYKPEEFREDVSNLWTDEVTQ